MGGYYQAQPTHDNMPRFAQIRRCSATPLAEKQSEVAGEIPRSSRARKADEKSGALCHND